MGNRIDLNCDMGESFGVYSFGSDEKLMQYISSANIACGAHAGDPHVMNHTVQLAKQYNVFIGAHPGFPDLAGFGRRMIECSPTEIYQMVVYQIGSLQAFCTIHNVSMTHVKPHGALYNFAARNQEAANAIAKAVYDLNPKLILFGLAGSELIAAGQAIGLQIASEVFADRTYQPDGSLTPRSEKGALIEDATEAVKQVRDMVQHGVVEAVNGEKIAIEADTVCIHGDGNHATEFVKLLTDTLVDAGIAIKSIGEQ
ncbi:UPF0271 protein [Oceanobacillus limi]|uniref:5-oxoprolinase subunit A n=1 Tax=Oceanobacillus limi TaxID=930131 RepID=A0A1I0BN41_9BACI|nr:5-oxoprolinase subunit PxpA [Oceanobacillus limi]SET08387.1 UPF0271 protein [Oceanobacillus limi]